MTLMLIVDQSAEVALGLPAQQIEGGAYTRTRMAPGAHSAVVTGTKPGRETLVFQLEDQSRIEIEVIVG